ncbi:MAG: PorV/PorQ family protein [candidate division FCPU426 bacterium]
MRQLLAGLMILLLLPAGMVYGRGVGTSAANFLKVGQGARPAGMGSAFVALADDINSLEWNPAGLSLLTPDYFDMSFQHSFWLADVEYEMLSYAQYLGEAYGAGLMLMYRHMPDVDNNLSDEQPLQVYDFAGQLGYGFQISNFSVGLNLKIVTTHLGTVDLTGEAVDLGMLVHFMERKLNIGLVIQNLGPDVSNDSLPLGIRGGFGYKDLFGENKEHAFNAGLEINQPLDNKLNLNLGAEYWYMKTFALRLGFRQQLGGNDLQTDNFLHRMTIGTSVVWADLQLDYAFASFADLGATHRLALKLHYGPLTDELSKF